MKLTLNEYGVLETPRQGEVRELLLKGLTNREIGKELGIKEKSVKWLTTALFKAWDVKSRHQLMARVFELHKMNGMLPIRLLKADTPKLPEGN